MGITSTPAAKIRTRTQSASSRTGDKDPREPSSSITSLPSSADFRTPSPQSQIPDLSSPSIPSIGTIKRKRDIFDVAYIPSPKRRTTSSVEDWNKLIEDAQEQDDGMQETPEGLGSDDYEEGDLGGTALFGWKEDVMWSLHGSTETTPGHPLSTSRSRSTTRRFLDIDHTSEDEVDDPTKRNETVYQDVLVSMNDNTRQSQSSLSSRAQARSSTLRNRQPTPHKRSSEALGASQEESRESTSSGSHQTPNDAGPDQTAFFTARTSQGQVTDESLSQLPIFGENNEIEAISGVEADRPKSHKKGSGSSIISPKPILGLSQADSNESLSQLPIFGTDPSSVVDGDKGGAKSSGRQARFSSVTDSPPSAKLRSPISPLSASHFESKASHPKLSTSPRQDHPDQPIPRRLPDRSSVQHSFKIHNDEPDHHSHSQASTADNYSQSPSHSIDIGRAREIPLDYYDPPETAYRDHSPDIEIQQPNFEGGDLDLTPHLASSDGFEAIVTPSRTPQKSDCQGLDGSIAGWYAFRLIGKLIL